MSLANFIMLILFFFNVHADDAAVVKINWKNFMNEAAQYKMSSGESLFHRSPSKNEETLIFDHAGEFAGVTCGKGSELVSNASGIGHGYTFRTTVNSEGSCKYKDFDFYGNITFEKNGTPSGIGFNISTKRNVNYAYKISVPFEVSFSFSEVNQATKELKSFGLKNPKFLVTDGSEYRTEVLLLEPSKFDGIDKLPAFTTVMYYNDKNRVDERGITDITAPKGQMLNERGIPAQELMLYRSKFGGVVLAKDFVFNGIKFLAGEKLYFKNTGPGIKSLQLELAEVNRNILNPKDKEVKMRAFKYNKGVLTETEYIEDKD